MTGNGHDRVSAMLYAWADARARLAELDREEHPDITDAEGRVWVWWKGSLYRHESKAWPAEFICQADDTFCG